MGSEDLCLNQTFFLLTQIKFGFCLVLSPTAYVVPAQIKVKEGFQPAPSLAWEITARMVLACSRTVGRVPEPRRGSNKFQTLLEVAR